MIISECSLQCVQDVSQMEKSYRVKFYLKYVQSKISVIFQCFQDRLWPKNQEKMERRKNNLLL